MTLKLKFPNIKHKEKYEKLIEYWWKIEDTDKISPWALFYWENFNEFLNKIEEVKNNPPKWYTNSSLFFLIENDKILWWIDIRHDIKAPILNEKWWHIWYWIAPKFRKKWYATKMLELWLIEAKNIWLDKALITCDIDNIGSKKVIEKNWWIFERLTNDWKMNRYWIKL